MTTTKHAAGILLVSGSPIQRPCLQLAEALVRAGHRITVAWDRADTECSMQCQMPSVIIVDSEPGKTTLPCLSPRPHGPRILMLRVFARVKAIVRAVAHAVSPRATRFA